MSKKKNKPFRPKARRPRGFEDKPAELLRAERKLIDAAFVFALQDDDDQWLSLRYDLTAPLARFVAENYDALAKPYRRYQAGSVFRNEKPGPGRFREFVQCDADSVGAAGPAADAEMIMLAADVMRAAGLKDGQYAIRVNNRKLLDGILESSGVPNTTAGAAQRLQVLRSIDKLDRLGVGAVGELLTTGRKDESGDYTPGAGLNENAATMVIQFIGASESVNSREQTITRLFGLIGQSERGKAGVKELADIDSILNATGFGDDRVSFDTSIVRGLGYYTGPWLNWRRRAL